MVNLFKETVDKLAENGKLPLDVRWVGDLTGDAVGSWDEFATLAADFDYDNGFGLNYISLSLVVVGDNWWLERSEYDGSEGWDFKRQPQRKSVPTKLTIDTIKDRW